MREFDENGRILCKIQARIFEQSIEKAKCSSAVFLRRFMLSSAAARFDNIFYLFESCSDDAVFEEIENQFGVSSYGSEKYSANELYWMGYVYRFWCYTHEKTSKQVYEIIKPKELRLLYFPYHSLDNAAVVERILEAKNITEKETDLTARGVEILRKLQNTAV